MRYAESQYFHRYRAPAVHFDGESVLECSSFNSLGSAAVISFVAWVNFDGSVTGTNSLFALDPTNTDAVDMSFTNSSGSPVPKLFTTNSALSLNETMNGTAFSHSGWHCIIGTIDASATGKGKFYVDDVDNTSGFSGWSAAFNISFNGSPLWVGYNGAFTFLGDMADLRIMPGVSLLTSGNISLNTRRLFIDANGKPVDPAVATAALGRPAVLMSGDHFSFLANNGTGGNFNLFATVSGGGNITNASTSPSDGQPTVNITDTEWGLISGFYS
jgi:hypothetical protein